MAYIEISYTLPADKKLRLGYRKADSGQPFTYLSNYLTFADSPYTLSPLEEGSYEIELTTATASCINNPCGTPQVIRVAAADPNTIYTTISIGIDTNKNVYFSAEFTEKLQSSITINGSYTISGQTKSYSIVVPKDVMSYTTIINQTTFPSVDSYCYSSVNPTTVNNKGVVVSATKC